MPFSFLAPAFLAGLALLAVPIILHLVHRPKDRVIEFPSLMFLDPVAYRSATRRRLRHPWLLLLRCLALAAAAAAFARPVLDRPPAAVAGGPATGREVVILVDRSYSMGYGDRFARALAAARDAVAAVTPDDRATLVFFDAGAAAVNRATADRDRLLASLDTLHVGAGRTRYAPALRLAASILGDSELPQREVILISDFQRVGWEADAEVRLPPGTVLTPVPVADGPSPNTFVTSVSFRRERFSGRERVTATARLVHRGDATADDVPVTLELDGRALQSRRVDLPADGAATVTFEPFTLERAGTRGTVRAAGDALPADDGFHFVLSPGTAVSVLIIERSGSGPHPSLYLRRALGIGTSPAFDVEVAKVERLSAADLEGHDVVVLNDAPFPAGAAGRRLRAWVEDGGGLILIAGERTRGGLDGAGEGLLPAAPGRAIERDEARGGALGAIDYDHPVFELFRAPQSGDLTAARFFRYRALDWPTGEGVLARFDDGGVALAERQVGRGRVLVWMSTLDASWNDLALQPVFLPFVHRLTQYAAGAREARAWATVGELLDLRGVEGVDPDAGDAAGAAGSDAAPAARSGAAAAGSDAGSGASPGPSRAAPVPAAFGGAAPVVVTPSGRRVTLEGDGALLRLDEQGFYELRDPRGITPPRTVAVNLDIAESDLTALDPALLAAAVAPPATVDAPAAAPAAASDPQRDAERERRQVVWWYLLIGALVLLTGEAVLSNRLSRATG